MSAAQTSALAAAPASPPTPPAATPALALDRLGRGLADAVHGTQQVYRALLAAFAHPGRLQRLPAALLQGLDTPGLRPALAAALLTLLDAETGLWLPACWQATAAAQGATVADWLRFHTGTRTGLALAAAPFAAADLPALAAERLDPAALWHSLPWGTDELPQDGATLLLEVPALTNPGTNPDAEADPGRLHLTLRGPGIADSQTLEVAGLAAAFWQAREALAPAYPRGVDLLLCCGDTLAAVPRTTRVQYGADHPPEA